MRRIIRSTTTLTTVNAPMRATRDVDALDTRLCDQDMVRSVDRYGEPATYDDGRPRYNWPASEARRNARVMMAMRSVKGSVKGVK